MKRLFLALLLAAVVTPPALAAFIFRVGDTVYVDGKQYSWEEWKKIRDNPDALTQSQTVASAPAAGTRAAACTTAIYYDEFPSEDERFQCSAGLGALTREQILEKGWKVDFVEKIPPPYGQPAQSPRGLPLYLYKLVISRYGGYRSESPQQRTPSSISRSVDTLCMNDCLGSGGTKEVCGDRCTY